MSSFSKESLEEAGLISKKTNAVYDYQFIKLLQKIPWKEWYESSDGVRCQDEYLEYYAGWLKQSQLNVITGLDLFKKRHLINGTTQTFDESYLRYADRRLRLFRGEYAYHRRVVKHWAFIEDAPLEKNDYIIVSAPFCSTGDVHPQMTSVLSVASEMKIPVIVDCAYFGTCENFHLDLNFPCIESVSFSLSKGLGLGDLRSGIRFSNIDDNFPISQQNNYMHTVHATAKIGLYMMKNLGPDFIPNKYSTAQKQVCEELGLTPTKCMHLALGQGPQWDDYIIDGEYRRVGIRNLVKARFKNEI